MSVADRLGFGPMRISNTTPDGKMFRVDVTPPALMGLPTRFVILSPEQHERYLAWRTGKGMIQDLLSDLSDSDLEILMTGIGDEDFHRMFKED